jgi:hypothetical protein
LSGAEGRRPVWLYNAIIVTQRFRVNPGRVTIHYIHMRSKELSEIISVSNVIHWRFKAPEGRGDEIVQYHPCSYDCGLCKL